MQGTNEWLEQRRLFRETKCGVTSSRFAAALGLNPFCSRAKQWRMEMKDERDEQNWAMKFGIDNEKYVLAQFLSFLRANNNVPFTYEERGFVIYDKDDRFGGSPDGLIMWENGERSLIELKCAVGEISGMRTEAPIYHLIQIVGLCAIFNLTHAYYASWAPYENGGQLIVSEMLIDLKLFTKYYKPKIIEFIGFKKTKKQPPRMKSKDKKALIAATAKYIDVYAPATMK